MKRLAFAIVAALVLGGCAASGTPYKPASGPTFHFADTRLAEGYYRVSFGASRDAKGDANRDIGFMHGAELCRTAGYEHVMLMSWSVDVDQIYFANLATAQVEVRCSHDAGVGRPVADVIAEMRSKYPEQVAAN